MIFEIFLEQDNEKDYFIFSVLTIIKHFTKQNF